MTFSFYSRQSLQTPQPWIPATGLDPEALQGLISDQVLREKDAAVTFVHDVFADWALLKLLAQNKVQVTHTISIYQEAYALERPLRLLASRSLESAGSSQEWLELLTVFEEARQLSPRWRDIVLIAPVFSSQASEILPLLERPLLAENGKYLAQVLIALRTFATIPHPSRALLFTAEEIESNAEIRAYWTAPLEPMWIPVLQLLLGLGQQIPAGALLATSEAISFWMGRTSLVGQLAIR